MKFFLICALVAAVAADVSHLPSNDYLPPSYGAAASEPAASYAEPSYSPAASSPGVSYAAPAVESYETAASEPAHSFSSNDGYRYKTNRRRVVLRRHRRGAPSNDYLPPFQGAASAPSNEYLAPAASNYEVAASAPAVNYAAPAAVESYETAASEPAHSFSSNDGYRYRTNRRRVVLRRHRRGAPSNDYLPPFQGAASAPSNEYLAPAASNYEVAASAPAVNYAAPAAVESYETAASEPAHSFSSNDGYRYRTNRRRVVLRRHRRGAPSNDYLPPFQGAASAPSNEYLAPAASNYEVAASAPAVNYAAPAAVESYETAASEPAHSFSSNDGYRYRTNRRRVVLRRHRRGAPSNDYLPPFQGAASAPTSEYLPPAASAPAPSYQAAPSYEVAASAPASYAAPAAVESYDTAASEPAHSFSANDGYRYKTQRRRVVRRRRY